MNFYTTHGRSDNVTTLFFAGENEKVDRADDGISIYADRIKILFEDENEFVDISDVMHSFNRASITTTEPLKRLNQKSLDQLKLDSEMRTKMIKVIFDED